MLCCHVSICSETMNQRDRQLRPLMRCSHRVAGSVPSGPENLLASLPRVVREMCIATVQAAAAQAHLEAVQSEATGLEGAVQTAKASLPEERAAAEAAAQDATLAAPVDVQVCRSCRLSDNALFIHSAGCSLLATSVEQSQSAPHRT